MYNDNTVRPLIDFEGKHFSMRQAFTTSIKERFTEKKKIQLLSAYAYADGRNFVAKNHCGILLNTWRRMGFAF